jgi:hypothetical protein
MELLRKKQQVIAKKIAEVKDNELTKVPVISQPPTLSPLSMPIFAKDDKFAPRPEVYLHDASTLVWS